MAQPLGELLPAMRQKLQTSSSVSGDDSVEGEDCSFCSGIIHCLRLLTAVFFIIIIFVLLNKSPALCGSREEAASVSAPLFSALALYFQLPPGAGWEVCLQRIWLLDSKL